MAVYVFCCNAQSKSHSDPDTDQRDPKGVLAQSFTAIDKNSKIAKDNSI
jgi:hypothetical protein